MLTELRPIVPLFILMQMASAFVCAQPRAIDFEPSGGTFPDGSLAKDDIAFTDQYSSLGIEFALDTDSNGDPDVNSFPLLEAQDSSTGDQTHGFQSTTGPGPYDTEHPDNSGELGRYFLRTPRNSKPTLLILYTDSPTSAASGEIWDIDANLSVFEQWKITGLDRTGSPIPGLEVKSLPGKPLSDPASLDSKPWRWELRSGGSPSIWRIRIEHIGTSRGVGLGFDNFIAHVNGTERCAEICCLGACCNGLKCVETTARDCSDYGGIFHGTGSKCELGNCIIDDWCFSASEEACLDDGGEYLDSEPCPIRVDL